MSDEWLDEEGYPTDAALARITAWPYHDIEGALEFMRSLWHWDDWATRGHLTQAECDVAGIFSDEMNQTWRFATGGWSGNESLINAWQANRIGWAYSHRLTVRGGLYVFQSKEDQ